MMYMCMISIRLQDVERANEANAIETLMVSDELFRLLKCRSDIHVLLYYIM